MTSGGQWILGGWRITTGECFLVECTNNMTNVITTSTTPYQTACKPWHNHPHRQVERLQRIGTTWIYSSCRKSSCRIWHGGVVVIRSPHDPEVPSSNPGKNNTSDFSIRDPLSLPSCDWYRIYLAMWWNSSVGRAADLIYTCQVRCRGFDSRCFPHI